MARRRLLSVIALLTVARAEQFHASKRIAKPNLLVSAKPPPPPPPSRRGLIILAGLLAFATDSNGAMLGAFFSNHLVARGITTTAIGSGLGISSGIGLLGVAPIAPRLIRKLGAARMMLCSALVYAACRFAMATLAPVNNPTILIRSAAILLTIQACADACCDIAASTTILTSVPPSERTQAQGTFQAMRSLGGLIAPPIGGWLYLKGGFGLPFIAFGTFLLLACMPLLHSVLFSDASASTQPDTSAASGGGDFSILRVQCVRWLMGTMTIMAACLSFPSSYFSPFLKSEWSLNEGFIGLLMMGATVLFTSASIGAHKLESLIGQVGLLTSGNLVTAIGFFLISSLPPFHLLPRTIPIAALSMCCVYAGIGLVFAAASPLCVKLAEANGVSSDDAASQVTSLWVLAFALAGTTAPPLGGWLAQRYGARWANSVAGALAAVSTLPLVWLA